MVKIQKPRSGGAERGFWIKNRSTPPVRANRNIANTNNDRSREPGAHGGRTIGVGMDSHSAKHDATQRLGNARGFPRRHGCRMLSASLFDGGSLGGGALRF